ncbi:MAG TPA: hypothetical protein DIW43_16405 [Spongiibacteraceae bacterium]|nr:hypothetical protein [Spongiibacteraceae bacterium]
MHIDQYLEGFRLLADADAQLKYERDVPTANVPAELVCMWFDDLNAAEPSAVLPPAGASRVKAFSKFRSCGLTTSRAWHLTLRSRRTVLRAAVDGQGR